MINVGIVGCGNIATTLAGVMKQLGDNISLVAVASRDKARAEAFARKFEVPKAYGSYEELYNDEDVQLVYVATPHSHHYEVMIDALNHGKHILCEKAFTVNAKEAEEVFALAREKKCYVAEAIWTRYMPSRKAIREAIESGEIGEITTITANLSYPIIAKERIAEPSLAGGALLDVGVYPLNFALMAMEGERIKEVTGSCVKSQKGVDVRNMITITYENGAQAILFSDAECLSDRKGVIYGKCGRIEIENVNNPAVMNVYLVDANRQSELKRSVSFEHEINGYEYELLSADKCINEGLIEDPNMPWKDTLYVLRYMDALREIWGIRLGRELTE